VLRDVDSFASDWRRSFASERRRVGEELPPAVRSIHTLDLDEHASVRRLFADGFRHVDQRRMEDRIARRTRDRLTRLARRTSFDFITELAEPVALESVTDFLGVRPPDLARFIPVSHTIVDGMDAGLWPQTGAPALAAREELAGLTEFLLSRPPGKGPLGYLAARIRAAANDRATADRATDDGATDDGATYDRATGDRATDDGNGLDHTVACNSVRGLLHAGFESASRLLGTAMAALLAEPGGIARFARADHGLATAELVRFATPVQAAGRFCVADRTLGGVTIRRGQEVTVLLGAANRDPIQFTLPDRLCLRRDPNRHLGFDRGAHTYLGSALATLQARVVFEAVTDYPAARAVAEPVFRRNVTLRGVERLEMSLS
jgi:hypothetical protein